MDRKWLVFIGLALSIMMVDIDITASNLALPILMKALSLSISHAQWIIDGYAIAACALMAFGGRCGDVFGLKKVMIFGLICFVVTSLCTGFSFSGPTIIISRILQGACIAFTFPIGTAIVRSVFPPKEQGFAVSLLISIAGISQAIGPTFGGLMISFASWRLIFLINAPLGLLAIFLLWKYFKDTKPTLDIELDAVAIVLLSVGLFALITALNVVNKIEPASWQMLTLVSISVASLITFSYKEIKADNPLLDLALLTDKNFCLLIVMRLTINFIYFSWLFVLGIYLQQALQYSTLHSGFIMLSLTLVVALLAVPVGKLLDKVGCHKPLIAGSVLLLVTSFALSSQAINHSLPGLLIVLFFAGAGTALLIPGTVTAAMKCIAIERMASAMGILFTLGFLGNSLGVAISGSVLSAYTLINGFSIVMLLCAALSIFAGALALFMRNDI